MSKTYKVALMRTYIVSIEAERKEQAISYSEFYLGNCSDLSTPMDRSKKKFAISDIELAENDATEILDIITKDEEEIKN
jgi:hypothetical protein